MTHDLNTIDYVEIEARARVLRAQAIRNGFVSFRNALANLFVSLSHRGSKTA